ncbi:MULTISPECIES: hypothetical protein [unclassified Lysinibacillus]|uniref:hypothetical protein n=1 Tax=unclassified Lysinibacillus TaxID=2636778 RepID=UPI00201341FD|nr:MULTISPECIES: hypothetical protein [unclassified Lysinibacillus]MCL1696263.1 hypothetical protein [Lysinibacillus sp. BPa_S21]MCL1700841.1 hypothetical protein [Lysinibacillus sp. Bpr_S20]
MTDIKVKSSYINNEFEDESVYSYCSKLSKRNNSILFLLESYLNKKLLSDSELAEIRNVILTVSADIIRLPSLLYVEDGDENEGL